MIDGQTVSLVLPCYNEEHGVRKVIESLPDGIDEIVVVDNNCTDRTAEVASSLGAKVVPHVRNIRVGRVAKSFTVARTVADEYHHFWLWVLY